MAVWICAFFLALLSGSLAEYWGHRAMHVGFKRARHVQHHQSASNQGLLREFFGYSRATWPLFGAGFLHSVPAGIAFALGGLCYSAFAAYAHELQHEHPECCFWLAQPVHYLHHSERLWQHNFGITTDIWDRVFGTYYRCEYQRPAPAWRHLVCIKWR